MTFNSYFQSFVYKFDNSIPDGGWIDTLGNKMASTPESCGTGSGCVRENDWPDLPSTSILKCEGQCRNGKAGMGPTDPVWISKFCIVEAEFFIKKKQKFEPRTYNLCRAVLVQDSAGSKIPGKTGKWMGKEISTSKWRATWNEYYTVLR